MSERPGSERPRSIVVMVAFVYLWLMVSIAVTTLSLNGPARWVTGQPDLAVWADEIWVLIPAMTAVLLASFLLTRWLLRRVILSRTQVARIGIPVAVTLIAVMSAWAWLTAPSGPSAHLSSGEHTSVVRVVEEL